MDREHAPDRSLLIKGNFKPTKGIRIFRVVILFLGGVLAVGIVTSLVMYGLVVHYESDINIIGEDTRILNEENKALQVKLNRLQSYQNVESSAVSVPHLKKAAEVIEVDARYTERRLPRLPEPETDLPRIYGY